ncbi:glycine betaine/L-proline ABC transporter substrate-binding protein ProX [Allomesorhizobium camelthorni]|uniref:Glycine betaine/L-proline ABC transporter substrate-binding protein ProX n=1 Tax=Allomesorhizobium camelthorni TaxID=475069 RepID=A0A6G4WML8_9HYPH|nr:glycine betaine/L-proline ABC transporter substrate-binding protein ProX [Mesorhizobium camelthorni]NGO55350.1 glycine betaine/L-proline ABC transporter substrate-binding protein ProX [Mesorhizobium camelthorni]
MNMRTSIVRNLSVCVALLTAGVTTGYAQMPGEGKTVQPITTGQSGHVFQHEVVRLGLEALGYEVKPALEADYPALHLAIGQGQADYTATHWVPLHQGFYDAAGGDQTLERVGVLIAGAGQGYFIDKATAEKNSITKLDQFASPEIAKLFDSDGDGKANLTGCNPGWGCEREIEHQIDAYKLRDTVSHNQGSYFALIADTITRYQAGQPIFYYTWSPQWVGSVLRPGRDVIQLDVPFSAATDGSDTALADGSNPGFKVNDIDILANKQFLAKNPAAKKFFELVKIPLDDVNAVILRQHEGEEKPEQITHQAHDWVAKNQAQFDSWVKEAATAQ